MLGEVVKKKKRQKHFDLLVTFVGDHWQTQSVVIYVTQTENTKELHTRVVMV